MIPLLVKLPFHARLFSRHTQLILLKKICSSIICCAFFISQISTSAFAISPYSLPTPGSLLTSSMAFTPVLLQGVTIDPDDPLQFEFVVTDGNQQLPELKLKTETERLIKYFLAALTVPEEDLWVNLSPAEQDRIIPDQFGSTEMGRDLLAQDYILKQLTSSLLYPEDNQGKIFWQKLYDTAKKKLGNTQIPMDAFNKVWIVPEKAEVYETGSGVLITESTLDVMLEQDYIAMQHHRNPEHQNPVAKKSSDSLSPEIAQIMRETLIPEIKREVNEGEHFAPLRQIYQSLILASWFKHAQRKSLLGQTYVDQRKILGVDIWNKNDKQKIYNKYLTSYRDGVYSFIKEDEDPVTHDTIPRYYFSGGTRLGLGKNGPGTTGTASEATSRLNEQGKTFRAKPEIDEAMIAKEVALPNNAPIPSKLKKAIAQIDSRNYSREALEDLFSAMPKDGSEVLAQNFSTLSVDKRREMLFTTLVNDKHRSKSGRRLFFNPSIDSSEKMMAAIDQADEILTAIKRQTKKADQPSSAEIYATLKDTGLSWGWGKDLDSIHKMINNVKILLNNDSDSLSIENIWEEINNELPLVWAVVEQTPHGFFNQNFDMGEDDTGGQVVYLVEYAREMAKELRRRVDQSGIPEEERVYPQVILATRQIMENTFLKNVEKEMEKEKKKKNKKNILTPQEYEKKRKDAKERWERNKHSEAREQIKDDEGNEIDNAWILRVPFRDAQGQVIDEWIRRQEVWPYIIEYAKESHRVIQEFLQEQGLSGQVDMHVGNYSDGSVVTLINSMIDQTPFFVIPHAIERSKEKRGDSDGTLHYEANKKDFLDIQFAWDVITMGLGGYINPSSVQEKNEQFVDLLDGTLTSPEQWELIKGLGASRFNIGHLGATSESVNHKRAPEQLEKEAAIFKNMLHELTRLAEHSSDQKQQSIYALIHKLQQTHTERYQDTSIEAEEEFTSLMDKIKTTDTGNAKPVTFFYTIARLDPIKNMVALIKAMQGTEQLRQSLIGFIQSNKTLNSTYAQDLKVLARGRLSKRLLSSEFTKHLPEKGTIRNKLFRIKDLREKSVVLIAGGPESVGAATDQVAELLQEIEDIAQDSGLDKDALMRWPATPSPLLYPIMKKINGVFIQSALSEGYGITILEAMANGPLICTKNAGAVDLFKDNPILNKWLFDPFSETDLFEKMSQMVNLNEHEKQDLAQKFLEQYRSAAGWDNKARQDLRFASMVLAEYSTPEGKDVLLNREARLQRLSQNVIDLTKKRFPGKATNEMLAMDIITTQPIASHPQTDESMVTKTDSATETGKDVGGIDLQQIRLAFKNKGPEAAVASLDPEKIARWRQRLQGLEIESVHLVPVSIEQIIPNLAKNE